MYLGIGLGTSSVKIVILGEDEQLLTQSTSSLTVSRPVEQWSEQNPSHWWLATNLAIAELKRDHPEFGPGDIIKVYYKIREKDKTRLHPVEGIIIKLQGAMHRKTFTLRRIAYGQAYEVTFPYYSPNIDKIEIIDQPRPAPMQIDSTGMTFLHAPHPIYATEQITTFLLLDR